MDLWWVLGKTEILKEFCLRSFEDGAGSGTLS
jgi:hypothetical protein